MELDEFKLAWQALDRRLDRQTLLFLQDRRERHGERMRSSLRPLLIGQCVQILAGLALAFGAGSFWFAHRGETHWLVSGMLLHVYGLMFIVLGARELALIGAIDYAAPVLAVQRQLAALRAWHLRCHWLFGVAGCFAWIPFALIAFKAAFGVDLWRDAPGLAWAFIASGFAGLALFGGALRLFASRPVLGRRVGASMLGGSLREAQAQLDEVARFECG